MTTQQTERELFEKEYRCHVKALGWDADVAFRRFDSGEYVINTIGAAWKAWQIARAPLLSTIAQQGEALEAAMKDSERLDYLVFNEAVVINGDGPCYWVERNFVDCVFVQPGSYETPREAIDAALISQKVEG